MSHKPISKLFRIRITMWCFGLYLLYTYKHGSPCRMMLLEVPKDTKGIAISKQQQHPRKCEVMVVYNTVNAWSIVCPHKWVSQIYLPKKSINKCGLVFCLLYKRRLNPKHHWTCDCLSFCLLKLSVCCNISSPTVYTGTTSLMLVLTNSVYLWEHWSLSRQFGKPPLINVLWPWTKPPTLTFPAYVVFLAQHLLVQACNEM